MNSCTKWQGWGLGTPKNKVNRSSPLVRHLIPSKYAPKAFKEHLYFKRILQKIFSFYITLGNWLITFSSYFPSPTPSLKRFSTVLWPQSIPRNILAKFTKNLILRRKPQIHFQRPEKKQLHTRKNS